MADVRLIGLTGGIATGKSEVARGLRRHGAAVVDTDEIARDVVKPDSAGLRAITGHFGTSIVNADGSLNREQLAAVVFRDAEQRHALEDIVHPLIRASMWQQIRAARASDAPLIVAVVPLLYEVGLDQDIAGVLLVYSSVAMQRQRLVEHRGLDGAQVDQRLRAQMSIDEKRARATWVIDNVGTLNELQSLVDAWWDETVGTSPLGISDAATD